MNFKWFGLHNSKIVFFYTAVDVTLSMNLKDKSHVDIFQMNYVTPEVKILPTNYFTLFLSSVLWKFKMCGKNSPFCHM